MYYTKFRSRFCEIILAGDAKGLEHLHLHTGEGRRKFEIQPDWKFNPDFFGDIQTQILEYLEGYRKTFDVPINPTGTDFQKKVWGQVLQIPYGCLTSYKDIAKKLGNGNASRAVGAANGKNPIPLIIPCHRVVGTNGGLTGFAHGLTIKEQLIGLESGTVS